MLYRGICELLILSLIAVFPALVSTEWQNKITREQSLAPSEISPEDAAIIPSNRLLLVDARSREDFARGHPPGAVLLNAAGWDSLIAGFYDAWEPEKKIIVYGRARSDETAAVAHRLQTESGLDEVWVLKGIWEECR